MAATNADLKQLIKESKFREDLYFRLKVVTIQVPPLREHPESIPLLCIHYLSQAEALVNKQSVGLSKGALAKLKAYSWPGNIRELVNCVTRACIMAEEDVILAEDIRLEGEAGLYTTIGLDSTPEGSKGHKENGEHNTAPDKTSAIQEDDAETDQEAPVEPKPDKVQAAYIATSDKLNKRQKVAYDYLKKHKVLTRSLYEELINDNISSRTAIYDLNGLVKLGLAEKQGKGPATKYTLN